MISSADGKAIADAYGMKFYETSAANSINVQEAFVTLGTDIFKSNNANNNGKNNNKSKPSNNSTSNTITDLAADGGQISPDQDGDASNKPKSSCC